jgi:hypothetical protein
MSYHAVVLQHGGFDPAVAPSWDALPPKRGVQADFYDSHAWLSSWSHAARAVVAAGLRVPAVLDCGRPVALLPLEGRSRRRPAGLGQPPPSGSPISVILDPRAAAELYHCGRILAARAARWPSSGPRPKCG